MRISTTGFIKCLLFLCITLLLPFGVYAQQNFGGSQQSGRSGLLCANCIVTGGSNAADGNLQTYSTINVAVGLLAQTWQEIIFPGAVVAGGTPATIKLGSGNSLLSLQALGAISLQAYNNTTPVGVPIAANRLVSLLSNSNQVLATFTPGGDYDRIRVTLNGGLAGVLSSIYLYEAYYTNNAAAACTQAFDELHGISAGLLNLELNVGGVVNPQQAIDGNPATASTLNAGVGLVGAYAQQTLIFNNLSAIGDSVRLTLSIPQNLLDAGVLSNISISTFRGDSSNNDAISTSASLLNVRLLDLNGSRRRVTITYAPTQVFDRVQLRLGGGIANVLSTLDFYEGQRLITRPVVTYNGTVAGNTQACSGSSVTLNVNAVPNTTFKWYTAATGGAPVSTGAQFTTPALADSTTYYVEAVRSGCTDASERTPVRINVSPVPAAPTIAQADLNICAGKFATFAAAAVNGVVVNWYTTPTGGIPVATGNTFTTSSLTQTTTYYAEAVAGGQCISAARTPVTTTVATPPAQPGFTAATVAVCSSEAAVLSVANPQAGLQYNWYSTATGGTILYTGNTFTTPALTANADYYVEAVNAAGCSSTQRAQASVTVQPKLADAILQANSTAVSAGQSATISVSNAQTGNTYNWYTSPTAATPVFTGVTYQTAPLYANTTYYVGVVNSTGCLSASRTPVTIQVNINTNAPCSFANQQSSAINGVCLACDIDNRALAVDADTATASTIRVTAGLSGGYAEQELRFQQAGLAGDTIKLVLQTPVGLADVSLLSQIEVAVLNGTNQAARYALNNSTIQVRALGGGSNRYAVYIPATGNYDRLSVRLNSGLAGLLTSLQVYYAAQQFMTPVVNPASPEICKGSSAQLNITAPAGGTFNWYTTPTGGTAVATGSSFNTPALNGNTSYYIEYARNGCVSPVRYPVQVLVNDVPTAPVAGAGQVTINSGQTATLTATPPTNATVQWYTTAAGGTPVATGNTFTTPALTTNTTYYAGSALGSCVSATRTPVNITVNPVVIPDIAVNPPSQTVNPGQTATFTASSTTPGAVFNWYTTATGGTPVYTGATFVTPAQFANTTFYAEAVVPATGAVSATRATATVTVNQSGPNPVACDAAIDQTTDVNGVVCLGCSIANTTGAIDNDRNTFSQLNVPVGLLNAYAQQTLRFANTGHAGDSVVVELGIPGSLADVGLLSRIGLSTYNGSTYNNDRFTVNGSLIGVSLLSGQSRFRIAFAVQQDFDRVEIRLNSAAAGALTSLNIYDAAQAVAAPVVATANVAACGGSQATLTASVPDGVTVRWYTTPTGGTPVFTGTTFTTPALNTTTTYYAEASRTATGCVQSVRTPATVTVTAVPAAPQIANTTLTVCSGQSASFTAQAVSGATVNWYTAPTGGTPVFTGNTFTTGPLTSTINYYAEAIVNGQCASTTRSLVTASVNNEVPVPVITQSPVPVCAGSSAVLSATSTQAGVTFNWYTTATGGTPVFTGAQFTTPALSSNTSYYVEAVAGNCVSTQRARADVVVNPAPVAPVVAVNPAGGQITSGQTATLTASSTTAGTSFNWYTTPTGGTPVYTGAVFTTPTLTNITTYYVESFVTASGCISASRTPVTIIVNPVFATNCDFANTQSININGGLACVGCTIANPDNAVDSDTTNFSRLNITAGIAGSFVAQQLIFPEGGNVGDTVSVRLRFPVNIASAGVLDRIRIASYNGNSYNNDGVLLNANTVRVQVLAGGQTALIRFAPQAAFDRVEVRLNGAVAGLFSTFDVFYSSKQVEAPLLAATTANICSGNTATFSVSNARNGVTYNWYTTPTGGAPVATGTTFTTPTLSATTTYYVESVRSANSCPNPNRVAATVNVTPTPANPVLAQNNIQACAGEQVALTVTNAIGTTVNWYDAPTGGNLLFTGATFGVSPIVTTSYYAELINGSCNSPARTQATVTINPRPSAPGLLATNTQVCAGSNAVLQVLNPENGVTYQWFFSQSGGTPVFTGATFTTPAISQNTTYYVQATSAAGCTNNGGRVAANITVNGQVAAPVVSASQTEVCYGGSASVSIVNPVAGLQYNWFTTAIGGTPVFTGTTLSLNNLTTNTTFYAEAISSTGCISATRTAAAITVRPVPVQPQVQAPVGGLSICAGSNATVSIANAQANVVYRWFNAATGGTLLYTGTQFTTPALTTTATYYVEAAEAGNCNASARTPVTITINVLPQDAMLINANVAVCAGSPATFAIASPQAGVTYQWFDSPARTNMVFEGTTFVTGPINTNTTYYVAAISAAGCSSANLATAQVSVQQAPGAPLVANGSTVQTCTGAAATLTLANPENGFTYRWYTAATGGAPIFTGTTFTTAALTGNTTYYIEAANAGGCVSSSRTAVNITVNALPASPAVTAQGSATPSVCTGSSATLTATSATADVTFKWYTAATGGTPVFTGVAFTTPTLTAATTYYVEAVANATGCVSATRTPVQVAVNELPQDVVLAANNVTVCAGAPATLTISSPQAGVTYQWFDSADRSNKVFEGTTFVTGPMTANMTYYVVGVNAAGCGSANAVSGQVMVQSAPTTPIIANGGTAQTCAGSAVTLDIASPVSGYTYNWYTSATGGTPVFTGTSFTTGALTGNVTYFAEAVNTTGCASAARASVAVTVNVLPALPVVAAQGGAANPAVCTGSSITLTATSTMPDVTFNWYIAATGGTPVFTGQQFVTPALTANTTYYVEAVSNSSGCASATRAAIGITVNGLPHDVVLANDNAEVCLGTTATFSINAPQQGVTYQWYTSPDRTTKVFEGTTYTTGPVTSSTEFYVVAVNASGCVSANAAIARVTVQAAPNAPVIANGSAVQTCTGSAVTLTIATPATGYTYNWYTTANGGTLVYSGASFTTANLISNTTYYVEAVNGSGCVSETRTQVDVSITPLPVAPVVTAQGGASSPVTCTNSQVTLTASSTTADVTYNWYSQATGGTPVFTGATYITPVLTANTTYYVEAVSNNGGCVSPTRTPVSITVNATPQDVVLATNSVSVCSGNTATFTVSSPQAGTTYQWFDSADRSNKVFEGTTFVTSAITANITYYVIAVNTSGCTSANATTAQVTVQQAPAVPVIANGSAVSTCTGTQVTLTIANPDNGLTYNWYTSASGGTPVFTGTSFATGTLSENATYYVEAVNAAGCTSAARSVVAVNVNPSPVAPVVTAQGGSASPVVCTGSGIALTATSTTSGVTFNWYTQSSGGTPVFTGSTFTTPSLTSNTTYYVEAVSNNGGCVSATRTPISVTVTELPQDVVLVATDVNVCAGSSATLSVNSPQAGVTYQWFDSPARTNSIFEGTTFVTGAINTNTTYYVAAINAAGCTSANLTAARVIVQQAPAAPVIANGNVLQACNGSTVAVMVANPQTGIVYNWYANATGGSPIATGANFTTPVLAGNTTYYVDAVNGTGCTSAIRTAVTINVGPIPASPVVTAQGGVTTPSVCAGGSAILTATSNTAGVTFNWYTSATGGTPVFTGATFVTPVLTTATTYYAEAVSNIGGCVSATRTPVQISINTMQAAAPSVNADDLQVCQQSAAILHITNPDAATTYSWYISASATSPVYTGTAFTTRVLNANTTYYVQAVSTQSCNPSARIPVNVVVLPKPATPVLAATIINVCAGSPATLTIASPQQGVTYNWYNSASQTDLLFTGAVYTTGPINANATYYVSASNGSCSSSTLASVQVNVAPAPATPVVVSNDVAVCAGGQATLAVANPQAGITYQWYTSASGTSAVFTGTIITTPQITTDVIWYVGAVNSTGCASSSRAPVRVTVAPAPVAPQISAQGTRVCAGSTATLAATVNSPGLTIRWYASATGGTVLFTGSQFVTPVINSATTYYADAINAGGCTSSTRTPVTVQIESVLNAPVVTVEAVTTSSVTFRWNSVSGSTGYQISLDNGQTFSNPSSGATGLTHTVTGLQPGDKVTILVKATRQAACLLDALSDAVTGTADNPMGNDLYIPNAFSPNGDGNNDYFQVYGPGVKNMTLWIYDQWGEMQFRGLNQSQGWDGTYKGRQQPVGVYVYILEATMNDGQVIRKKGTINLIR